MAPSRVSADPNVRPFSGLGNWDRCCETLVWGMEEGRWRMRCNCDGNASTLKLARFPCVLWIVRDAAVLPGTAWLPRQLAQKWGPIAADNVAENGLRRHTYFPSYFLKTFATPKAWPENGLVFGPAIRPRFWGRKTVSFLGPKNGHPYYAVLTGAVFRHPKRDRFLVSELGPQCGPKNVAIFRPWK